MANECTELNQPVMLSNLLTPPTGLEAFSHSHSCEANPSVPALLLKERKKKLIKKRILFLEKIILIDKIQISINIY